MAPGLTAPLPEYNPTSVDSIDRQSYTPPTKETNKESNKQRQPITTIAVHYSGIKTSGQHPPLYDQLKPYSEFPKEIIGPTVWKAEDYANYPDRWTHEFTKDEIAEMSDAADRFLAGNVPLTHISKVCPKLKHPHFLPFCPKKTNIFVSP